LKSDFEIKSEKEERKSIRHKPKAKPIQEKPRLKRAYDRPTEPAGFRTMRVYLKRGRQERYIPPIVKYNVEFRDKGICQYCGRPAEAIDHIIPWSRGGSSVAVCNLVQACNRCNHLAGSRDFNSFEEKKTWILKHIQIEKVNQNIP
jgi:5-methylcytosine-specific restriction endonuclease McrA